MKTQQNEPSAASSLVTPETFKQVARARSTEAELNSLSLRLKDLDEELATSSVKDLFERRAALLRSVGPPALDVDVQARRHDAALAMLIGALWSWDDLHLPFMHEGISDKSGSNAKGQILTTFLGPGSIWYSGNLEAIGSQWWVRNWGNSAVFPPAPFNGKLMYRFTVEGKCHVHEAAGVRGGNFGKFVSLAKTSDADAGPLGNFSGEPWPVWVALPLPNHVNLQGAVSVADSIVVQTGKRPALGLIYGTIALATDGRVAFYGDFRTRRIVPPGATPQPSDYGRIQYRFVPDWWTDFLVRAEADLKLELSS